MVTETPKTALDSKKLFGLSYENSEMRERLKKIAIEAGGQKELADVLNIPLRTLSNYITGKNDPKVSTVAEIASYAGVSLDWLVFGKGDKSLKSEPAQYGPGEAPGLAQTAAAVYTDLYEAGNLIEPDIFVELCETMHALYVEMGIADIDILENTDPRAKKLNKLMTLAFTKK